MLSKAGWELSGASGTPSSWLATQPQGLHCDAQPAVTSSQQVPVLHAYHTHHHARPAGWWLHSWQLQGHSTEAPPCAMAHLTWQWRQALELGRQETLPAELFPPSRCWFHSHVAPAIATGKRKGISPRSTSREYSPCLHDQLMATQPT